MKTKLLLLFTLIVAITVNNSFAQKWEKDQPNKLFAVDKNGNFNNVKVGIGTNNPQYPFEVIGIAKADSLVINNGAHIFGKLHVGNNSLIIGSGPQVGVSDEITSSNGMINLGGDYLNTFLNFSDIKVGIGTQDPFGSLSAIDYPVTFGLEVNNDINLTSNVQNHGYRISGVVVLQTPGGNNTFVGKGAGFDNQIIFSSSANNSFVGNNAGYHNLGGASNSFFGNEAGYNSTQTNGSVFIGDHAGYTFNGPPFVGSLNTFVGAKSGNLTETGFYNTFIGADACQFNVTGEENTSLGAEAGNKNKGGNRNTYIGRFADASDINFSGSTAIGYGATVSASNCIVLGYIPGVNPNIPSTSPIPRTKVGIGTTIPWTRLEIVDVAIGDGNSGLRLSGFGNSYMPNIPANGKVLSVNNDGDVILVNGGGGSGNTTICGTIPENFITKRVPGNNTICKSLIYDNDFRVGIGNFDPANPPLSALNVNTNLIPGGISGEMFRTDGPADQTNYWRLYTGTIEKGSFFVPSTSINDFVMQASVSTGRLLFNAGGNTSRMIINGNTGATRGFVGIGQNFTDPRSLLHIHDGAGSAYVQVTNNFSQPNASDGMRFGILTAGIGVINQQENRPIYVYTNSGALNTVKMYIGHDATTNEARVGIGTGTTIPANLLELNTTDPTPNTTIGGSSGLTFQDLTAASTTLTTNPGTGVLSVDLNGKVVYVPRGGDGNITACPSGVNLNFLSKWTNTANPELCNSIVYDNVTNVGVGNFTPTNLPLAALHVNTNLIPGGESGDVFRTDCPNIDSYWRMYRYGSEKLRFTSPFTSPAGGNNDVMIENRQRGAMLFGTGNVNRMIILDGQNPDAQTGFVGIGNNFYAPTSQLHINDGTFATYTQITNNATGATNSDGLRFGIAQNGNVEVIQQEGDNINPSPIRLKFYDGTILQERVTMLNNGHVGIGTITPNAMLEINSPDLSPTTTVGGNSGLLFQDLTATSTPLPTNPGTGVLSVDATGKVVYVQGGGSGSFADYDWEHIPATGVFSGHPNSGGFNDQNVYAGFTPTQLSLIPLPTKFAAFNDFGDLGNSGNIGSITSFSLNTYNQPIDYSKALGVIGVANGNRCGIKGTQNTGGYFRAGDAETNIGGYFYASCCDSPYDGPTYGLWAATEHCATSYAGYFDGNVTVMGNFSNPSDITIKENIIPISNALNSLQQLNPVKFDFKTGQFPQLGLPSGSQYGFIAQEIELIYPELVSSHTTPQIFDLDGNITRDSITLKEIDYIRILPIAIQGIKELKSENDSLKNIIATYENRFTSIEEMLLQCCTQQNKSLQTDVNATIKISSDPTMKQTLLYQNHPNPFNAKTTFAYTLGEGGNVELIVEDSYGRLVTTLVSQNQTPGDYSIDWDAENITSGIYFYSLKVNGIVLVKKAMKF